MSKESNGESNSLNDENKTNGEPNSPGGESETKEKLNLSWEEYKLHLDMYKFYIELGLKANVFFFAIVGAILSVLYQTVTLGGGQTERAIYILPKPVVRLFLITPFLISIVLCAAFFVGAFQWGRGASKINKEIKAQSKEEGFLVAQKIQMLTWLLFVFGLIFIVTAYFLFRIIQTTNIFG